VNGEMNGKRCAKYTYQFAHELCHYIIDKPLPKSIGRFDWFEESLCELASFFCLKKMSQTWQINPPDSNWCDYAICLEKYPENQEFIQKDKIPTPFVDWLNTNIEELFKNRYMRKENTIIASQLFPIFMSQPNHWKTIHYLKYVKVTNEMTLKDFLQEWQQLVPEYLKNLVDEISSAFI
jgi:hypothetical protein